MALVGFRNRLFRVAEWGGRNRLRLQAGTQQAHGDGQQHAASIHARLLEQHSDQYTEALRPTRTTYPHSRLTLGV